MKDFIEIRGARQHNLKGIDLRIPRRRITVITGPSGSGKSSLAFDTIYAEGQRRYVESLSAYARQFLERMKKPDVDFIDGLSPAVAIEQKNPTRTSRSTVGTATEIYDYLRLLWARVGRTICPACGRELKPDSPQSAADATLALPQGSRVHVTFPLRLSSKVTHGQVVENLKAKGFVRVVVDGEAVHLDELPPGTNLTKADELLVVADRLVVSAEARSRFTEAYEIAMVEGDGEAVALAESREPRVAGFKTGDESRELSTLDSRRTSADSRPSTLASRLRFTSRFECPNDGHQAPSPSPQLFSFNNPRGACATCNGFGATLEYDLALIVPYPERTLSGGA
ncbi:MAG: excinuclease ABC subunit A, partial [Gemmatimonadales bacterium]